MKKLTALSAALTVFLTLTACGEKEGERSPEAEIMLEHAESVSLNMSAELEGETVPQNEQDGETSAENEKMLNSTDTVTTSLEDVSQNIEIDVQLKSELINVIECYYCLKDLLGGRYCYITDRYETRSLSDEYSSSDFKYNSEIKYCEFDTTDDFYSIYNDLFFRNNKAMIFSSSKITKNDYEEIVLSYLTAEFYNENFYGIFDDIIDDDNYVTPSKYWYSDGNLLINLGSEYIYGGTNDYSYFAVNEITNDNIVITTIRKYSEGDSHVQFSFILENNLWKISNICYLD
ncbi:MAG: hypothetical protein NC253_09235 [Ruminococcus sp.]|nr:hypothetical protein [Ruminococcus sp.]MCM1479301.1 hypothetical protein [Muribaculaceae bacterium]